MTTFSVSNVRRFEMHKMNRHYDTSLNAIHSWMRTWPITHYDHFLNRRLFLLSLIFFSLLLPINMRFLLHFLFTLSKSFSRTSAKIYTKQELSSNPRFSTFHLQSQRSETISFLYLRYKKFV